MNEAISLHSGKAYRLGHCEGNIFGKMFSDVFIITLNKIR